MNYYMPSAKGRTPAGVRPPGEILKEELETRDWSQQELADILGRPPRLISEIVGGKRAITPETAVGLGAALGTSPEYWMALESSYQLSKLKGIPEGVKQKATLYAKFPIRELVRKGWVEWSEDFIELERNVCRFFGISSIDDEPMIPHAAKKTRAFQEPTIEQNAWLFRVRSLAANKSLPSYSQKKLESTLELLKKCRQEPEDVAKVAPALAECGVCLIFVEPIASSKIDGACMWLRDIPVVGMTLRYDRIDNFWFVLRHEIEHVLRGDGREGYVLDVSVGEGDAALPKSELLANAAAADFCAPQNELKNFIEKFSPYFSEERVLAFARQIDVHPGLVVGQLQRKLGRHDFLRKYQVKIRHAALNDALADGWGVRPIFDVQKEKSASRGR